MTDSIVLETRALGYRAPDGAVLIEGASLTARRGEIVAVAGPNGAGKTTLVKLLAGLLPPSDGELRLFGVPAADLSPRQRARQVAFVGQRENPDPRLQVEDYVALGRIPHQRRCSRESHARAVDFAVSAVGLGDKRKTRLGQLSGGEMQRLLIARALCQQPQILFLDEPTNHLDPKAKGDLLSLIVGLGITTVCVLHDLTLIPGLASHTILVDAASPVAAGPTGETLTGAAVRRVFGVDFFHLAHPSQGRSVPVLDIQIQNTNHPARENT